MLVNLKRGVTTMLLPALAWSLLVGVSAACHASSAPTVLGGAQDSLLVQALYSNQYHMSGLQFPDGSVGVNNEWENGQSPDWYIELQREGGDLIQGATVLGKPALKTVGASQLNWGWGRQIYDPVNKFYSFGLASASTYPDQETDDAFHSTSLFLEDAARAILIEQQAGVAYDKTKITPIENAADWLMNPAIAPNGILDDTPYTHRRWLLADALAESAAVSSNAGFKASANQVAAQYAEMGIAQQWANGIDPEAGGFDVSYQMVGMINAERYYTLCANPTLQSEVLQAIVRGLNWELTMIDSDNNIVTAGSTRIGSEAGRDGSIKTVDYKELLQALTYGAYLTGNPRYETAAQGIARNIQWTPSGNMLDDFEGESLSGPMWYLDDGIQMAIDCVDRPTELDGTVSAYSGDITFTGAGGDQMAQLRATGYQWVVTNPGGIELWLKAALTNSNGAVVPCSSNQLWLQLVEQQDATNPSVYTDRFRADIGNLPGSSTWTLVTIPFSSFIRDGGSSNSTKINFTLVNRLDIGATIPVGDTLSLVTDDIQVYTTPAPTQPTTIASLSGTEINGWYNTNVQVSLSATDPLGSANVAATYYQVDGGATAQYTGAFPIDSNGMHTVSYWSVNKQDVAEAPRFAYFSQDLTPPVTTAHPSGTVNNQGVYTTVITTTLTAYDPISQVQATFYAIDNGTVRQYVSPFLLGAQGPHTITYWSVDNAGNTESVKTLHVTVI